MRRLIVARLEKRRSEVVPPDGTSPPLVCVALCHAAVARMPNPLLYQPLSRSNRCSGVPPNAPVAPPLSRSSGGRMESMRTSSFSLRVCDSENWTRLPGPAPRKLHRPDAKPPARDRPAAPSPESPARPCGPVCFEKLISQRSSSLLVEK